VRETVARRFPPVAPACFRLEDPLWVPARDLDPGDLMRPGRRRKAKQPAPEAPPKPPEPVWTPDGWAETFGPAEPTAEAVVLTSAMADGLSERRASILFDAAE
jgi:hypothetical protein